MSHMTQPPSIQPNFTTVKNNLRKKVEVGKKIIAVYITLGYPDLEKSLELMIQASAFVDVIEIGIPYSDPVADGPIIQHTSQIALENGIRPEDVWYVVQELRKHSDVSIVIMTYGNLILQYPNFRELFLENEVNGIILPDMPPETFPLSLGELCPIFLVAPNSDPSRIKLITESSFIYVYLVSQLATTGSNKMIDSRLIEIVNRIKAVDKVKPILVGFGISTIDDVKEVLDIGVDGIIIGSALLRKLKKNGINGAITYLNKIKKFIDEYE